MRAVAYARVSVREEDIMNQVKAIEKYAKENNIHIEEFFLDRAVSGASDPFKRDEFLKMYNYCKENNINLILIYDLTRLGRSLVASIQALKRLLDEGFEVYFIKHNMKANLKDPTSKVMIYTLLMVAELERDFMRMRQEEAWRQGKQKGRPPKITIRELELYLRRYPNISISALTKIINADRRRKGLPEVSYYTVFKKIKEMGYKRLLVKS